MYGFSHHCDKPDLGRKGLFGLRLAGTVHHGGKVLLQERDKVGLTVVKKQEEVGICAQRAFSFVIQSQT